MRLATTLLFAVASALAATPEDLVKQAAEGWTTAAVKQDAGGLSKYMAADLQYAHAGGQTQNRDQYIAAVTKGPARYESFTFGDLKIVLYGKAAVLTGFVGVLVACDVFGQGLAVSWPVYLALQAAVFWGIATILLREQLLATSAVGAVVVGFALQDTLGNFFAGVAIQIEKPFRVGHWINIGGSEGQVEQVTWRATKLRTKDGQFLIVPNSVISKDPILNYSEPTVPTLLQVEVGASYLTSPNDVRAAIHRALANASLVMRDPAPEVIVTGFGDSAIPYAARFWIADYAQDLAAKDVPEAGAADPGGIHEFAVPDRQHLPADQPGSAGPAEDREDQDQAEHLERRRYRIPRAVEALGQGGHHGQSDDEKGHGEGEVDQCADRSVRPAAEEAGDQADEHAHRHLQPEIRVGQQHGELVGRQAQRQPVRGGEEREDRPPDDDGRDEELAQAERPPEQREAVGGDHGGHDAEEQAQGPEPPLQKVVRERPHDVQPFGRADGEHHRGRDPEVEHQVPGCPHRRPRPAHLAARKTGAASCGPDRSRVCVSFQPSAGVVNCR